MKEEDSPIKMSAIEEARAKKRMEKQERKLAKKSQKEAEFLLNLRKPKDTKVVLADKSFIENLINNNRNGIASSNHSSSFSIQDFPELSPSKSAPKQNKKAATYKNVVKTSTGMMPKELFPPISGKEVTTSNADHNAVVQNYTPEDNVISQESNTSPKQQQSNEPNVEPKRKTRKKTEPIVIKLSDLAEVKKKKKKKVKGLVVWSNKFRRKTGPDLLYGNMLDSSNPKRRKGKHREIKKVTFTKLKLAILKDRIAKLKGRENKDTCIDKDKFKAELGQYLSDLMAKKLKLDKKNKTEDVEKDAVRQNVSYANATKNEVAPAEEVAKKKTKKGHTKYRKYCDNKYSKELDEAVTALIKRSVYLQDRAFATDPIKARAKQRHVTGLREVRKYLMLMKVSMLILAPDLEAHDSVTEVIEGLKKTAAQQNVPYVFALSRRGLGYVTKKKIPVSAFAILSYDGLEDKYTEVKDRLKEAREMAKKDQETEDKVV